MPIIRLILDFNHPKFLIIIVALVQGGGFDVELK